MTGHCGGSIASLASVAGVEDPTPLNPAGQAAVGCTHGGGQLTHKFDGRKGVNAEKTECIEQGPRDSSAYRRRKTGLPLLESYGSGLDLTGYVSGSKGESLSQARST